MQGFFSLDGPFYKFGTILADIMILSMIWLLFSIPIVTIGASTTALYYVMTRRISNREGYLFRDFWTSFKGNFKQTTIIWLIFWVLAYILYINITNIEIIGSMATIIKPIQICFCIELILIFMYIMPINARFQIGLKDSFKTAFFMANRHLPTSILCALIAFGVFLASWITIIMSLVAMGIYVYLTSFLFLRVFKKYRPEIDLDPQALEQFNANLKAENKDAISKVETVIIDSRTFEKNKPISDNLAEPDKPRENSHD